MTVHTYASPRHPLTARIARWTSPTNWALTMIGLYLALAPLWTPGAPSGWFVLLGLDIVVLALCVPAGDRIGLTALVALGMLTFLLPWLAGFTATGFAALTAWVLGCAAMALAVSGLVRRAMGRH